MFFFHTRKTQKSRNFPSFCIFSPLAVSTRKISDKDRISNCIIQPVVPKLEGRNHPVLWILKFQKLQEVQDMPGHKVSRGLNIRMIGMSGQLQI